MDWRAVARRIERGVVWVLLIGTPRRRRVVINGYPDTEGNAVEMVRACAMRFPGEVVWLVSDFSRARAILRDTNADPDQRVTLIPHRSLSGMRAFVGAELSMFTHGLYGNPRRVPRKIMVNLWHGGGFKKHIMSDSKGKPTIFSDYLVASTEQFGRARARECQLPFDRLLLTGNPRTDQFRRADDEVRSRLGFDEHRPFVLWMPTFRRHRHYGLVSGWSDVAGEAVDVNSQMVEAARILKENGIDLVVKPHPSDEENRSLPGSITLDTEVLTAAGVQLYELIGAAAGLITDYSSVWIDYLALNRPIGFVVPDEAQYTAGRGFDPADALDWLPGSRLRTPEDLRAFAVDVAEGGSTSAGRRREVAEHIGLFHRGRVADAVLDDLSALGAFRTPLRPAVTG